MTILLRLFAPVVVGLFALLVVGVARADGEAGLVIQNGDSVDTYCVPFAGDSINGADLLKKVSIPVARIGDLVCAVGNVGCFGASDYDSCTCKYASTGTYWAYFSQTYGQQWVYSGLSFALLKSKDGDMQAWRWGPGGANSAPPPPALSFEAVCGHPPRKAVAEATQPPPSTPTNTVAATASPAGPTVAATPTALPTLTETATAATVAATITQSARPPSTVSVTITSHGAATATAAPSITSSSSKGGGSKRDLVLFAAVAVVMLAIIGGALVWRRTHGR